MSHHIVAGAYGVALSEGVEVDQDDNLVHDETFVGRLSDDERTSLFAIGTRRRYPANTTIFFAGADAHEIIVVVDGLLKVVVVAPDGREVILDVLERGALIGEIASLDGGVRSATIHTLDLVDVVAIRQDEFDKYLLAHPHVFHNVARVVAKRLREGDQRQLEFGTGDAVGRLCVRLAELAKRYGVEGDDGFTRLVSPLSQADLAAWSGLSREAVVKAMRALRDLGWIQNNGSEITIVELRQVQKRADT